MNLEQFASTLTHENHQRFTRFQTRKQQRTSKVIGGYRIGGRLGEGSHGLVYAAYRLDNNKKLAVKILPKLPENGDRVENEVKILEAVRHPNIVKIEDVIWQGNRAFIFMQLCSKGDLFYHIRNKGKLPQPQSASIFIKILHSVIYLHNSSITHRDIKAQNILFDQQMTPKLTDFGLARFYNKASPLLDTWCGSFNYLAPEIIRKRKYRGQLVDLWSLCVLLYVMLVGREPFNPGGDDRGVTKDCVVGFQWGRCQGLSVEVLELFDAVFVPAQHRIGLAEVRGFAFYKKYAKEEENFETSVHKNQQYMITESYEPTEPLLSHRQSPKKPDQNPPSTLTNKFSQFSSETLQQPRNKIELIKYLRSEKNSKSVEPSNKFRVRRSLPKKMEFLFEL